MKGNKFINTRSNVIENKVKGSAFFSGGVLYRRFWENLKKSFKKKFYKVKENHGEGLVVRVVGLRREKNAPEVPGHPRFR